ncbi:MAG: hypothetical protein ACKVQC_05795 [Elusimicrobiota bacterium]
MKFIIGSILGAVVLFFWGTLSWMVLPLHNKALKPLPQERLIRDTIKTVVKEPGVYFFPSGIDSDGNKLDQSVLQESMRQGPNGFMALNINDGGMNGKTFLISFLTGLITAALCLWVLFRMKDSVKTYFTRVAAVVTIGFIGWVSFEIPYWNWFFFSTAHTFAAFIDAIVGFGLLGLVIAKFVPEEN